MTDEQILYLLQKGVSRSDMERGLKMMMERYQEKLYWVIRRMVQEHEDANDVLQNCFIKAFRNIQSFEGKSQLYTWLYRIATNESITFLNKKKKQATALMDNEDLKLSNQLAAEQPVDGYYIQEVLLKAIESLPEKQGIVFRLRYFEEVSYEEMSEMLDTSVGALKASFHHAVKKVENYIQGLDLI